MVKCCLMNRFAVWICIVFSFVFVSCGSSSKKKLNEASARIVFKNVVLFEADEKYNLQPTTTRNVEFGIEKLADGFEYQAAKSSSIAWEIQDFRPDKFSQQSGKIGEFSWSGQDCQVNSDFEEMIRLVANLTGAKTTPELGTSTFLGMNHCQVKFAIQCFTHDLKKMISLQSRESENIGKFLLSKVLASLENCARGDSFPKLNVESYFVIRNGLIIFEPVSLYSISIYDGDETSVEDAILRKNPVATISKLDCASDGKICLVSPLPLSDCKGCSDLKKGQIYTAFLFQKVNLSQAVPRFVFTAD